jgi:calcium-dependent protein kinase
VKVVVK